jgi:hypothetical protein
MEVGRRDHFEPAEAGFTATFTAWVEAVRYREQYARMEQTNAVQHLGGVWVNRAATLKARLEALAGGAVEALPGQ